jgi:transcriptional regulator with GAF, ATPase, and Fis domain
MELQAKLLRVLQEGELERVGEERTRRVDVRLLAATNRDLRAEAEAGRFRQDLFYRLSVFPVEVPALRRRKEDIPLLAAHFLEASSRKVGRPNPPLTLAAVQRLQQYAWPGNVRELQHVIERAVITSTGGRLNIELPAQAKGARSPEAVIADPVVRTDAQIRQFEADNIRARSRQPTARSPAPGCGSATRFEIHDLGFTDQSVGNRPTDPARAQSDLIDSSGSQRPTPAQEIVGHKPPSPGP